MSLNILLSPSVSKYRCISTISENGRINTRIQHWECGWLWQFDTVSISIREMHSQKIRFLCFLWRPKVTTRASIEHIYIHIHVCIYIVYEYNHINTHGVCSRDSQWYESSMQHAYALHVYHTYISAIFVCFWHPLATSWCRLTSGKRPKSMDAFQRPNCGKRGDALKLGSWMVDKQETKLTTSFFFFKGISNGCI